MSLVLIVVIIIFKNYLTTSVIDGLLILAGYTYGPLLGLFAFGIFTNYKIHDKYVWIVTSLSVFIMIFIGNLDPQYLGGYKIGYELLPINGEIGNCSYIAVIAFAKEALTIGFFSLFKSAVLE